MKVNGMKVKETDMVFLPKEMVTILKGIGLMIKEKVRAHISIATRTNFLLENGLMINQKLVSIQKLKMRMLILDQRDHISKIHMFCHKSQN